MLYNYIQQNLQILTYLVQIIQNYFQVMKLGSLMILVYIELLYIKH